MDGNTEQCRHYSNYAASKNDGIGSVNTMLVFEGNRFAPIF